MNLAGFHLRFGIAAHLRFGIAALDMAAHVGEGTRVGFGVVLC